jgi:hypothetical protein
LVRAEEKAGHVRHLDFLLVEQDHFADAAPRKHFHNRATHPATGEDGH